MVQFSNPWNMNAPFLFIYLLLVSVFLVSNQETRSHISYSNDVTNMDTLKLKFCIIDEML